MSRPSKPVALVIAALAAVATTTGILWARGRSSDAVGLHTVERGPVSVQYAAPWRGARVVASVPFGLELAAPAQLRKAYANLWVGRIVSSAPVPGGLPPGLASKVRNVPLRQKVELHGVPAMRYTGVIDPGASRFVLYVVATNQSDYAVLCTGATWKDADGCESLMRTVALDSGEVIAPGANVSLVHQLERLVSPLDEQSDLASGLASAKSPETVARRARHLGRLFHNAGRSLSGLEVPQRNQRAVEALAGTLVAEAQRLGELAKSIESSDGSTYDEAALAVEANNRMARAELSQLRGSGFIDLPMLPPISIPALPALGSPSGTAEGADEGSHGSSGTSPSEGGGDGIETAPGGDEWEPAEKVGGTGGDGTTGQTPEPKFEPAEPVEVEGAK
jgi:hypothetical protein